MYILYKLLVDFKINLNNINFNEDTFVVVKFVYDA